MSPQAQTEWDGYFVITGMAEDSVMVLSRCRKRKPYNKKSFDEFCNSAKEWLDIPVSFCIRTGMRSETDCVKAIKQNARYREVWLWNDSK